MRARLRPVLVVLACAVAVLLPPVSSVVARDDEVAAAVAVLERHAKEPFEQREREQALRRLGALGGPEAVVALFEIFEDPFVHLHDHATSAWIRMLEGDRAAPSREALETRALAHRRAAVRVGAATALGVAGGLEARPALEARLEREREPDVQAALVRALTRLGTPSATVAERLGARASGVALLALADGIVVPPEGSGPLPTLAPSARDPLARAAAVLVDAAAGRLGPDRVDEILADEAIEPRIALAEVVGHGGAHGDRLHPALARLLADGSWRVRAAAIAAARTCPTPAGVTALIDRLGEEEGRLRLDLLLALGALTGETIDDDAALWRAWWERHRATWKPSAGASRALPAAPALETSTRAFFRLPVRSTRVAFLIDCSGSMRDAAFPERPAAGSKWDRARAELAKTLEAFDEGTSFDVFLHRYPSSYPPRARMTRALGRLAPASPAAVRKAARWLAGEEAKGWGAFYDALVTIAGEDVDTIYFLSDGRPSRGTYDRDFRLLDEFDRANRFRQVAVHTVLVGRAKADRTFLQDLARRTGGLFVDATED